MVLIYSSLYLVRFCLLSELLYCVMNAQNLFIGLERRLRAILIMHLQFFANHYIIMDWRERNAICEWSRFAAMRKEVLSPNVFLAARSRREMIAMQETFGMLSATYGDDHE